MGDPRKRRAAVESLEYFMESNFPEYNHFIHDASLRPSKYMKDVQWDAILLGSTFLCKVLNDKEYKQTLIDYDWIHSSSAAKIALPQDDYNCSQRLDELFVSWSIDLVYTVLPKHFELLYPKFHMNGEIRTGYTGYIHEELIKKWKSPKSLNERKIDVSYRANKLTANYGHIGYLKGSIGERFIEAVQGQKLNLDISTNPKDVIAGDKWHEFLEDSKFCLVSPSGSSVLDPKGTLRNKVLNYMKKNPRANFKEVSEKCIPKENGKYVFTAISPRNIEAALSETVQIAIPDDYSDFLLPYEDYIPLREDFSNIKEVLSIMKDEVRVNSIRKSCKEKILNIPSLKITFLANEINDFIKKKRSQSDTLNIESSEIAFRKVKKYKNLKIKIYWYKTYFFDAVKNILKFFKETYEKSKR